MTYSVSLDVFEGPLDLLLHLVSKDRVNVADVSISTITEDYLKAIRQMEEIDLDVASSFLILAATLLELKSIRLLPEREEDPELTALLEERDHLLHRLIEYSMFKRAGLVIADGLAANQEFFVRVADIPQELLEATPDPLEGVTVDQLASAAIKALAPKPTPQVDTHYIAPIRVSVRETIELLTQQLRSRKVASFSELCKEAVARIEIIVRFLALLEMFRHSSVELEQPRPFDDIIVRWRQPATRPVEGVQQTHQVGPLGDEYEG
ncbi:MAG: segregation and condensation protein A [Acidimicrobiia bacterium]